MEKEVKRSFCWLLFVDILLIIVGLLILFFQAETVKVISYLLGASIALIGILGIVRFFMRKDERFFTKYGIVYGIAFLIIAFLLLWKDHVIIHVLPFALGMIIIICSTLRFDDVMNFRSNHKEIWKVLFFLGLTELLFGGILTFRLFRSVFFVHQEIAVCCVFVGILDIASNWICKMFFSDSTQVVVSDVKEEEVSVRKKESSDYKKDLDEKKEAIESKKKKETSKKKAAPNKKTSTTQKKNEKHQQSKNKNEKNKPVME